MSVHLPDRDALGLSRRFMLWLGAAALMVLPILPERLSGEVPWQADDFAFLALLLLLAGVAFEIAARTPPPRAFRIAVLIAVAAGLVQLWLNVAVGIIGSENNPANWLFAAPIAVALLGACFARLEPLGMKRAMFAAAVAQALVLIAALFAARAFPAPATVFFVALWLTSAWLFDRSPALAGRTARGDRRQIW